MFFKNSHTYPPGVVIGCGDNTLNCQHKLHSDKNFFYSIDINPSNKPDKVADITQAPLAKELSNKFHLTFLEALPYYTYNFDPLNKESSNYKSRLGMQNILSITHPDGFIVISGNSREFHYRSLFCTMNYFEINNPDTNVSILILPKDQLLKAHEALNKFDRLPLALKNFFVAITEYENYSANIPGEYCSLSYINLKCDAFISELRSYINNRGFENEDYLTVLTIGTKFNFGHSKLEKIKAATQLITVLLGDNDISTLKPFKQALNQGRLGAILNTYLQTENISSYRNASLSLRIDTDDHTMHNNQ